MNTDNNSLEGEENNSMRKMWGWPTYLSIVATIIILLILASRLDFIEVWEKFVAADKFYIIIAGLAHYSTYLVRGIRWRSCLTRFSLQDGTARFALLVFFYNFIDNVVPGKLADIYASHLARINFGIRRSAAMGSIVFLRMIDAWVVLFLAWLSSWILFSSKLPQSVFWTLIFGGVIAIGATSIILIFFIFKKSIPAFIPNKIIEMIRSFQTGMWPQSKKLFPIAFLTLVIWALESLWLFFLITAFGIDLSPIKILFITMIPLLASAFPLTPAGTGLVDATLFGCLRVVGVASPAAASLTVVNRFIDYWLHIGFGLILFSIRRLFNLRTWREVKLDGQSFLSANETR